MMGERIEKPDSRIEGAEYCFRNTNAVTGEIYNAAGEIPLIFTVARAARSTIS